LIEFGRELGYEAASHQQLLAEMLEAVERGDIRKLLFCLPPGSGKSIWTQIFALWYMARRAGRAVLGASNVAELAERFGRRIRGWAQQHGQTLGVQLDDTTQSAGHWALTNKSTYTAAGLGQSILGLRASILLVDDPVRSRTEAMSETVRETVWEWYHSSARTRCIPGSSEIICMTRFFESDLAGMLLDRESDWTVVNIPAEAESEDNWLHRRPGEFLWPGPYGYADMLQQVKRTTLPVIWSAMYQGRPAPEEGDYFKAEWFRPMTVMPARDHLHIYGASDYAVSEGRGDYTVHVVVGLDGDGTLYLLDCWRKQAASDESVEKFCDLVLQYKPIGWAQETGQINASLGPFMRTRQNARAAYVATETFPTRGDKSVRCQSIRGRLALNGMVVPTHTEWWPACRAEALSFPAAKHDDFCDALGLIGQVLDKMSSPHVTKPKEPPKVISTDAASCTVTLNDLWDAEDRRRSKLSPTARIK
jgi:predicted phage terminase large subunit-like protein